MMLLSGKLSKSFNLFFVVCPKQFVKTKVKRNMENALFKFGLFEVVLSSLFYCQNENLFRLKALPPKVLGFAALAAWCSVCRLPAQR
jgi:hypothetical protein